MSFWSRRLRGEGSRRWREKRSKGTWSSPRPSMPSFCTGDLDPQSSVAISYKQKNAPECHPTPPSPCHGAHTTGEGVRGVLGELGCKCENKEINPVYLHSSADILWTRVSILRFPLWSLSWEVWSPQCTNALCWDTVPFIQFLFWAPFLRTKVAAVTASDCPQAFVARVMLCHLTTGVTWGLHHVDKCAFPLSALGLFLFVLGLSLCAPVSPLPSLPSACPLSIACSHRTFFYLQSVATHLLPLDNSTNNQENAFQHDEVSWTMNV